MKRITFVGLAFIACLSGALAPEASATTVWVPVIKGNTYGHMCEVYAPDRPIWGKDACAADAIALNQGVSPKQLKPGTFVKMELTDGEISVILNKFGADTLKYVNPIVSDPAQPMRPAATNENLQSMAPPALSDARYSELIAKIDELAAGQTSVAAKVEEIANRPPSGGNGEPLYYGFTLGSWITFGILGAIGLGLLVFALTSLAALARQGKEQDARLKKFGDAFAQHPRLKPGEAREAIEKLGFALSQQEAAEAKLTGELTGARSEIETLRKQEADLRDALAKETAEAKAAAEKVAAAQQALEEAQKAGTASAEEIKRLEEAVISETERAAREERERIAAEKALETTVESHRKTLEGIKREEERTLHITEKNLAKMDS